MNETRLAEIALLLRGMREAAMTGRSMKQHGYAECLERGAAEIERLLSLVRDLQSDVHSLTVELRDLQNRLGEADRNTELAVRERDAARADTERAHHLLGCFAIEADNDTVQRAYALARKNTAEAAALSVPAVPPKDDSGGEQGSPCVETKEA